jgi:hypothetical protein
MVPFHFPFNIPVEIQRVLMMKKGMHRKEEGKEEIDGVLDHGLFYLVMPYQTLIL